MITIDVDLACGFILGKQGLWPGRRWRRAKGTEKAMRVMQYLQLDPLQIIARSHDIKLYSRVLDYTPGMWEGLTYRQRKFFDWWRLARRTADGCAAALARGHPPRARHRKDNALALYYLWRTGEVMTYHPERFERVYALTETVAPAHLIRESSEEEADRFLFREGVSFAGLARLKRVADSFFRGVPFANAKKIVEAMLADGELLEVKVDGWKDAHYGLSNDGGKFPGYS
jgi:uncharacterized protein YcaQ